MWLLVKNAIRYQLHQLAQVQLYALNILHCLVLIDVISATQHAEILKYKKKFAPFQPAERN